jgi:hypothetical protein
MLANQALCFKNKRRPPVSPNFSNSLEKRFRSKVSSHISTSIKFKLRKMLNLTNQSMIRKKLTTVERYLWEAFRSACNQKSS